MNLTREQTIEALEACLDDVEGKTCDGCPLKNTFNCFSILKETYCRYIKENEPAPSANDTSSEAESTANISQSKNNTVLEICQELDKRINGAFLIAYNKLDKAGQLAFDMGRDCERFMNRGKK
ncbi:MAG: hypothetical protein J5994_10690 [Ruminococcus sp.]|nr:hypothetical protein [Ruminococcus sp.]